LERGHCGEPLRLTPPSRERRMPADGTGRRPAQGRDSALRVALPTLDNGTLFCPLGSARTCDSSSMSTTSGPWIASSMSNTSSVCDHFRRRFALSHKF
jgi:hypothetical protein